MKKLTTATLAAALAAIAATGVALAAYPGQQYASHAHVSLHQARAITLRTAHGTIVSQELEYEGGGSGLRYTFDVKTPQGVREVGVDARNGTVLENTADGAPNGGVPGQKGGGEAGEGAGG